MLGFVILVGGLVCATLFTLMVVPLLFSLVLDAKTWVALHLLGRDPDY